MSIASAATVLGDICSVVDCEHKTAPTLPDGIPVIRTPNIGKGRLILEGVRRVSEQTYSAWTRRTRPVPGDLIMAREAPVGNVALIRPGQTVCLGQRTVLLRPREQVKTDAAYIGYLLNSEAVSAYVNLLSNGATVGHLNVSDIRRLKLPLFPPFEVQQKIAAVLSAYDDLIENNRRRIALLERMAEQLYREWFVRMRFPGHESAKFVKGVPLGWRQGRFGDLCRLQRGFDLPDSAIRPGEYPVVASTSIKAYHDVFKVEPPVVTTGRSGSLGEVLWTDEKAWPLNTTLFVKSFCGNSPFFVFHTLRTMHLESFNVGAGVPTLNRNHLASLPLNIPSPEVQEAFEAQLSPLHRLKQTLSKACTELARARNLLLPRLISGKLRIDDLDIQFPPSMQADG